jgi:hypothetical protein
MPVWLMVLPMGMAIGFFSKNQRVKQLTIFSTLCMFTYWLIVSGAETKLEWYDAPMYPFVGLICAAFVYWLYEKYTESGFVMRLNRPFIALLIFLFGVYLIPYQRIVSKTYQPEEFVWEIELYRLSYWLKEANKGKRDLDDHFLVYDIYNGHHEFYIHALQEKGVNFSEKTFLEVEPGDKIIVSEWSTLGKVNTYYEYELLEQEENIHRMLVTAKTDSLEFLLDQE